MPLSSIPTITSVPSNNKYGLSLNNDTPLASTGDNDDNV